MKQYLQDYEYHADVLATQFAIKYFNKDVETHWVANEIGGVIMINDYFFNMDEIVDFVRYKYTKKEMFAYKDYQVDCAMENKPMNINIKNFKKLKT